ncbi:hypothetical protein HUF18_00300 [Thalassolituus sp. ST750PaO-4]|uniref:CsiV family protein n=1 Tax=Thalassolituus sp. ST750PaO-4 TaxID=2742965 RepID=UPI001CE2566F|nr:hypothetical protein [Thalassolituus sp. ST750PaO-4]
MSQLFCRAFLLLCSVALPLSASAAPWYRVEMILVAYEDESLIDQELWPEVLETSATEDNESGSLQTEADTTPDYTWWLSPARYQQLHNALFAGFGFARIPKAEWPAPLQPLAELKMANEAERINKRSDMKVIWHQAWVEPIQEEGQAIRHNLNVRLQDKLDIQLTGNFELHRSRYLHINTDLQVQQYEIHEPAELSALTLPASDNRADYRNDLLAQTDMEASMAVDLPAPIRAARVQQSRRMRSNELHYIDHPMLGIVLKIIPVERAEDL